MYIGKPANKGVRFSENSQTVENLLRGRWFISSCWCCICWNDDMA